MTTYKIKVKGDEPGTHRAIEEDGTIVGPFGVALSPANGFYRVTHRHSGLKISELGSTDRRKALDATYELFERVTWWASHDVGRIAAMNKMKKSELKRVINGIADKHGCDGRKDERISL